MWYEKMGDKWQDFGAWDDISRKEDSDNDGNIEWKVNFQVAAMWRIRKKGFNCNFKMVGGIIFRYI